MTLEEKLSERRPEAVGSGDLNAVQPPKWEVPEEMETSCPPRHLVIEPGNQQTQVAAWEIPVS